MMVYEYPHVSSKFQCCTAMWVVHFAPFPGRSLRHLWVVAVNDEISRNGCSAVAVATWGPEHQSLLRENLLDKNQWTGQFGWYLYLYNKSLFGIVWLVFIVEMTSLWDLVGNQKCVSHWGFGVMVSVFRSESQHLSSFFTTVEYSSRQLGAPHLGEILFRR